MSLLKIINDQLHGAYLIYISKEYDVMIELSEIISIEEVCNLVSVKHNYCDEIIDTALCYKSEFSVKQIEKKIKEFNNGT